MNSRSLGKSGTWINRNEPANLKFKLCIYTLINGVLVGRAWINAKFINPNTNKEIEIKALVDTGTTFTVIPRHIYEELGLRTVGKRRVKTASGYVDMDESFALVEVGNKRGVSPVLVSNELNEVLIGVITLEALGLTVDPTTGELRETEILML